MTEEKLKAALIQAHNKGDKEAAQLFASKIKELRAQTQPTQDAQGEPQLSMYEQPQQRPQQPERSFGDMAIGAGEALLTTATGATAGAAGSLIGTLEGIVQAAREGKIGEPEAAQIIQQRAAELGGYGTYQPRSEDGQEYVQNIAEVAGMLPPTIAGVTGAQAAGMQQGLGRTAQLATANIPTPQAKPQAMGGLSVGAAEIPREQVRMQQAQELPVPLPLTKGMRTQDFAQQRFERETAKDPELGAPIRERMAELNQGINQNIDEFIAATGTQLPETAWRLETGNQVIKALESGYRSEKAKVDNAYKAARERGETQEIIDVSPLANYLNESRVDVTVAPVVGAIAKEAERLGVGRGKIDDGSFEILPMTIEQSETLRQRVNALTDNKNGQDLRRASQIKSIIDKAQDSAGGKVFQSARRQRQQLANKYENLAIIDQLLDTKGQYNDQRIAAENVVNKAIINGSVEDLKNLRRVLSTAGNEGVDALKEVRAAAVRHIRDEATRNVGRDPNGNPLISAAGMDKAIKTLDKNGKLDLIFGKSEANKLRLLNDVAKDILVAQPNAVNNSNTASVLLGTLDVMSSMATGVPVPVLLGLKTTRENIKKAKTTKQVKEALK